MILDLTHHSDVKVEPFFEYASCESIMFRKVNINQEKIYKTKSDMIYEVN